MTSDPAPATGKPRKAALAAWIGSALEYYDLAIYGTAAALVFPKIFFPEGNASAASIASFATFGVAYVARPIGAVIRVGQSRAVPSSAWTRTISATWSTVSVGLEYETPHRPLVWMWSRTEPSASAGPHAFPVSSGMWP